MPVKFKKYTVGGLPVGNIQDLGEGRFPRYRVEIYDEVGRDLGMRWEDWNYDDDGRYISQEHNPGYKRHLIRRGLPYDRRLARNARRLLAEANVPRPLHFEPQADAWHELIGFVPRAAAGGVDPAGPEAPPPPQVNLRKLQAYLVVLFRPDEAPKVCGVFRVEEEAKRHARVQIYPTEILYIEEDL